MEVQAAKMRESQSDKEMSDSPQDGDYEEEEVDVQAEQKEKTRLNQLKKSKNSFMKDLVTSRGKEPKKKEKSRDEQMKELINQAEKYASFLLSKHKMNNQG